MRVRGSDELLAGIADDPVFGPVILFGQGGTAAEIIRDRAIGLPPLNLSLAREMIGRARVARLLDGYRDLCELAWNKDPVFGVIGIQSGPRG